jgi:serine/threonine protein kinase
MNEVIAEREARFYLEVNGHESIIRTLGYVDSSLNLTIFIQEFAEYNDLAGVLMDNQFNLSQTILVEMFAQIADAMSYVASRNIVHGDLRCQNVLVFRVDPSEPKNNLVKLTDFGLARWTDQPPTNEDPTVIPIRYCAPEILRNNRHASYSEKTDVYSFGILIWEALSNSEIPYSSIAKDEDVRQKKLNNERLPQPQVCNRQLWVLMNNCWHKDPQQRPTFEEIRDRFMDITIIEVPHNLITASSHR